MMTDSWNNWWKQSGEGTLRHLVMLHWDPIDISDHFEVWNEYDEYLPGIARLLRQGVTEDKLTDHLKHIEKNEIEVGLSGRSRRVAKIMIDWYKRLGPEA